MTYQEMMEREETFREVSLTYLKNQASYSKPGKLYALGIRPRYDANGLILNGLIGGWLEAIIQKPRHTHQIQTECVRVKFADYNVMISVLAFHRGLYGHDLHIPNPAHPYLRRMATKHHTFWQHITSKYPVNRSPKPGFIGFSAEGIHHAK